MKPLMLPAPRPIAWVNEETLASVFALVAEAYLDPGQRPDSTAASPPPAPRVRTSSPPSAC